MYVFEFLFEKGNYVFFDYDVFFVQFFDDEFVVLVVDVYDDGFDGGVVFDENVQGKEVSDVIQRLIGMVFIIFDCVWYDCLS